MAWRYDATGELYWSVNARLDSAFSSGGLFESGANGDGTLFAPGTVANIGGTNAIPLETVRLKRMRDGREDYELMKWLDGHGRGADVDAVVDTAFPTAYSATSVKDGTGSASLLSARDSLLALARSELGAETTADVAFSSDRDGNLELYTMEDDGGVQTRLTDDPAADRFPAWSPDGQRIAWTRGSDLWVMAADGTSPVNLSEGIADTLSKPAWSKDGSQLVFVRRTGGHDEIWRMNADGGGIAAVVTFAAAGANSYDPTVNASDVVFYSQAGDLYRVNLSGTGRTPVLTGATVDEVPDLGNGGKRMAFSRSNNGATPYDVFTSRLDGTDRHNLTATSAGGAGVNDLHASFSPDDLRLVFVSFVGGDAEIWRIGADGLGAGALTSNTAGDMDPDWRTMSPPTPAYPCLTNPPGPPHGFGDVAAGAYYSDSVAWLVSSGITSGVGPGMFGPSQQVTRADGGLPVEGRVLANTRTAPHLWRCVDQRLLRPGRVVAGGSGGHGRNRPGDLLACSAGDTRADGHVPLETRRKPPPSQTNSFGDVSPSAYYSQAVSWLTEAQITSGVAPGMFGPNLKLNRWQMAVFLDRYAN